MSKQNGLKIGINLEAANVKAFAEAMRTEIKKVQATADKNPIDIKMSDKAVKQYSDLYNKFTNPKYSPFIAFPSIQTMDENFKKGDETNFNKNYSKFRNRTDIVDFGLSNLNGRLKSQGMAEIDISKLSPQLATQLYDIWDNAFKGLKANGKFASGEKEGKQLAESFYNDIIKGFGSQTKLYNKADKIVQEITGKTIQNKAGEKTKRDTIYKNRGAYFSESGFDPTGEYSIDSIFSASKTGKNQQSNVFEKERNNYTKLLMAFNELGNIDVDSQNIPEVDKSKLKAQIAVLQEKIAASLNEIESKFVDQIKNAETDIEDIKKDKVKWDNKAQKARTPETKNKYQEAANEAQKQIEEYKANQIAKAEATKSQFSAARNAFAPDLSNQVDYTEARKESLSDLAKTYQNNGAMSQKDIQKALNIIVNERTNSTISGMAEFNKVIEQYVGNCTTAAEATEKLQAVISKGQLKGWDISKQIEAQALYNQLDSLSKAENKPISRDIEQWYSSFSQSSSNEVGKFGTMLQSGIAILGGGDAGSSTIQPSQASLDALTELGQRLESLKANASGEINSTWLSQITAMIDVLQSALGSGSVGEEEFKSKVDAVSASLDEMVEKFQGAKVAEENLAGSDILNNSDGKNITSPTPPISNGDGGTVVQEGQAITEQANNAEEEISGLEAKSKEATTSISGDLSVVVDKFSELIALLKNLGTEDENALSQIPNQIKNITASVSELNEKLKATNIEEAGQQSQGTAEQISNNVVESQQQVQQQVDKTNEHIQNATKSFTEYASLINIPKSGNRDITKSLSKFDGDTVKENGRTLPTSESIKSLIKSINSDTKQGDSFENNKNELARRVNALGDSKQAQKIFGKANKDLYQEISLRIEKAKVAKEAYNKCETLLSEGINEFATIGNKSTKLTSKNMTKIKGLLENNEVQGTVDFLSKRYKISSSKNNETGLSKTVADEVKPVADTVDQGESQEITKMGELEGKVNEVTTAVNTKTEAFENEKAVVVSSIDVEIEKLGELISKLEAVQTSLSDNPLRLSIADDLEGVSLESLEKPIASLKETLNEGFVSGFEDLTRALNGLNISKTTITNIESLSNALLELKNSLNTETIGTSGFLDSLNGILSHAEELKNLASVLKASQEKIKETQSAVNQTGSTKAGTSLESDFNKQKKTLIEILQLEKQISSYDKNGDSNGLNLLKNKLESKRIEFDEKGKKINAYQSSYESAGKGEEFTNLTTAHDQEMQRIKAEAAQKEQEALKAQQLAQQEAAKQAEIAKQKEDSAARKNALDEAEKVRINQLTEVLDKQKSVYNEILQLKIEMSSLDSKENSDSISKLQQDIDSKKNLFLQYEKELNQFGDLYQSPKADGETSRKQDQRQALVSAGNKAQTTVTSNDVKSLISNYQKLVKLENQLSHAKVKQLMGVGSPEEIEGIQQEIQSLGELNNELITNEQLRKSILSSSSLTKRVQNAENKYANTIQSNSEAESKYTQYSAGLQDINERYVTPLNNIGFSQLAPQIDQANEKIEKLQVKLAQGKIGFAQFETSVANIVKPLTSVKAVAADSSEAIETMDRVLQSAGDNVKIGKSVKTTNSSLEKTATYVNELEGNLYTVAATYDKVTGAVTLNEKAVTKNVSVVSHAIDKWKSKLGQMLQYLSTYVSLYQVWNVIKQGIGVITELDTALSEMRKVSDETVASLQAYQKESFGVADAVGTTALQIDNSTADFMRLGETLDAAKESAKNANILLQVSEYESIDQATEAVIALKSAFKDLSEVQLNDIMNEVGNNFAISTEGIGEALKRSASSLTVSGDDAYESTALATAGNLVMQDPEKVGAGLKIISLRLNGTKAASQELTDAGEEIDGMITTQSKLRDTIMNATKIEDNGFKGFDIMNDDGSYKTTYEKLMGIAEIWDKIGERDKATGNTNQNLLLETMAGKNRSNVLASILQNPQTLEDAYEAAKNSEGSAEEELEKKLDSIEAKKAQFQNQAQELAYDALNSQTIKNFVDFGTSAVGVLDKIIDKLGLVSVSLGAVLSFKIGKHFLVDQGFGVKILSELKSTLTPNSVSKVYSDVLTKGFKQATIKAFQRGKWTSDFGDMLSKKQFQSYLTSSNLLSSKATPEMTKSLATINNSSGFMAKFMPNSTDINPQMLETYKKSLNGLDEAQQRAVISASSLNAAQKEQVITSMGLSEAVDAEAVAKHASLTADMQKIISTNVSVDTTQQQILKDIEAVGGIEALDAAKLKDILVTNGVTGVTQEAILAKFSEIGATNTLTGSIKANTQARLIAMATDPLTWIMAIVTAVGLLTHYIKENTETAEEAASRIKETISTAKQAKDEISSLEENYASASDTVSKYGQRYAELSQGVNTKTNANIDLSADEYSEFLDLTEKLAEAFPNLKTGIDDSGNSILNLSGDVDTVTGSLTNWLDKIKEANDLEINDRIPEVIGGVGAELEKSYNSTHTTTEVGNIIGATSSTGAHPTKVTVSKTEQIESWKTALEKANLDTLGDTNKVVFGNRIGSVYGSNGKEQTIGISKDSITEIITALGYSTETEDYTDKNNKDNVLGWNFTSGEVNKLLSNPELLSQKLDELITEQKSSESTTMSSINSEMSKYSKYLLQDDGIYKGYEEGSVSKSTLESIVNNLDWSQWAKEFAENGTEPEDDYKLAQSKIGQTAELYNNLSPENKAIVNDLYTKTVEDFNGNIEEYVNYVNTQIGDNDNLKQLAGSNLTSAYQDLLDQRDQNITDIAGRGKNSKNDKNTLVSYLKDNDIVSKEDIELWNKYTAGAKDATDAIQKYIRASATAKNNSGFVTKTVEDYRSALKEIKKSVDGFGSLSEEGQKAEFDRLNTKENKYSETYDNISQMAKEAGMTIDRFLKDVDRKDIADQIDAIWTAMGEDGQKSLRDLAKETRVTKKDIEDLADSDSSLKQMIDDTGMSTDLLAECFNNLALSGGSAFDNLSSDAIAFSEVINGIEGYLEDADDAYKRFQKSTEEDDYDTQYNNYQEVARAFEANIDAHNYGKTFRKQAAFLMNNTTAAMENPEDIVNAYNKNKLMYTEDTETSTNPGLINFLDKLYSDQDFLNSLSGGSSITKTSSGNYKPEFYTEDYDEIAQHLNMTTESVISFVEALQGLGGSASEFDMSELVKKVKEMDGAFLNNDKTVVNIQKLDETLQGAGVSDPDERLRYINRIKEDKNIQVVDFSTKDYDGNEYKADNLQSTLGELSNKKIMGDNALSVDSKNKTISLKSYRDLVNEMQIGGEQALAYAQALSHELGYSFVDSAGKATKSLETALSTGIDDTQDLINNIKTAGDLAEAKASISDSLSMLQSKVSDNPTGYKDQIDENTGFNLSNFSIDATGAEDAQTKFESFETFFDRNFVKDGKIDLEVEGVVDAKRTLTYLAIQKQQLCQPAVMDIKVSTEAAETELGQGVKTIQDIVSQNNEIELKATLNEDTTDLETQRNELISKLQQSAKQDDTGILQSFVSQISITDKDGKNIDPKTFIQDFNKELEKWSGENGEELGLKVDEKTIADQVASGITDGFSRLKFHFDKETMTLTVDADTSKAESKIDDTKDKVDDLNTTTAEPVIGANTFGANHQLDEIKEKAGILDKTNSTVTVNASTSTAETNLGKIWTATSKILAAFNANKLLKNKVLGGKASANGQNNYFANHFAFAGGKHSALVGELGTELMVSPQTGQWKTIGDNGAEFVDNIPNDAIIFNHKQTKRLLSNGKINSRGLSLDGGSSINSAFANGTAHAVKKKNTGSTVTINSDVVSSANKVNKDNVNKSSDSKDSDSSNKSGSKTIKEALEEFQDYVGQLFDWIEIKLSRQSDRIDNYLGKAERALNRKSYSTSSTNYRNAIYSTATQMNYEKLGASKYYSQANSILNNAKGKGLIDSKTLKNIKTSVADGSIRISRYGEKMQAVIKAYQEWYEKGKEASKAVTELNSKLLEYVDNLKEVADAQREARETQLDNYGNVGNNFVAGNTSMKNSQLRYSNTLLSEKNKAYSTAASNVNSQVSSLGGAANKTISKALKTKNSKYKKALQNAQKAIKAKNAVASADLSVISKYNTTLYGRLIAYNYSLSVLQDSRYENAVNFAANTVERYNNNAEAYSNIEDSYNDAIDLLKQQASNSTSYDSANGNLLSVIGNYDKILQNKNNEVNLYTTQLNGYSNTVKKGATISKLAKNSSGYNSVKKAIDAAVSSVKQEKLISESTINSLANYYSKGYISYGFYQACVNYNNALGSKEQAEAQLKITEETVKADKIATGNDMLSNVRSYYEQQSNANSAEEGITKSQQDLLTTKGGTLTSKDYQALLGYSNKEEENLVNKQNALINTIDSISNSVYKYEDTSEYKEAMIELDQLTSSITDCQKAQEEYNNAIINLPIEKLDKELSVLDSIQKAISSANGLITAQGKDLSEVDYSKLVQSNITELNALEEKSAEIKKNLDASQADGYFGGKSKEDWEIAYNEILGDIDNLKVENEGLYDSIWQSYLVPIDKVCDKINNVIDLLGKVSDLVNEVYVDQDTGKFTDAGISKMSVYLQQLEQQKSLIAQTQSEISTLNQMYSQGQLGLSDKEYQDKLMELQKNLADYAGNEKSTVNSLIELWKQNAEGELTALNKIISKRKEALENKKNYYEFDKSIKSQNKDIQSLQAQIAALNGITDAEAKAKKAKLEAELQDKQDDLDDTMKSHLYEIQINGLDELQQDLQDGYDEYVKALAENYDKMTEVIKNSTTMVSESYGAIANAFKEAFEFLGVDSSYFSNVTGYASGTQSVDKNKYAWTQEGNKPEFIVRKSDGAILTPLGRGDGVIPNNLTSNLYDWGAISPADFKNGLTSTGSPQLNNNQLVSVHYDSLINVQGDVTRDSLPDLKTIVAQSYEYTSKALTKEFRMNGKK